jgi:hypothetical protein
MKNLLVITSSVLFLILISSCTTVYIPTEINAPAFNEPNQFKGGISVGSGGTSLNLGYSFYKNFGVITDFSYLDKRGSEPRFQRQWGVGLGYYTRAAKRDSIFYEVFGGFSSATTNSSYADQTFTNGPGYENADYYRIFLQNDFSYQQEFIDFIVSVKFSYFNFTRYESHELTNPEKPSAFGVEPAFKIRMGGEFLKIKLQMGYNLIANLKGPAFNYDRGFMLIGLECSF